jgi:hypothetical protein
VHKIEVFHNTVTITYHSHRSPGIVRTVKNRRGDIRNIYKMLVKSLKILNGSQEKIKMDLKKVT